MIVFRTEERDYRGSAALDIIRALEADAEDYPFRGQSIRQFLNWSLARLADRIPPREMDSSDRIEDEALALNYLYLRDEYGAGKLLASVEKNAARHSSS